MPPDESAVATKDFVVKIERGAEGKYRVLASSPAGEASSDFKLPFDERDLKIFLLEVGKPRGPASRGRVPEPMKQTKDFGGKLYDSILSGPVRDVFTRARYDAERGGYALRLQIRLTGSPELADIPWEFLYDGHEFVALSATTPLVRYFDLPDAPRPMEVTLPLRILVTISAPVNQPPLDVEQERMKLADALKTLKDRGVVQIDFMPDARLDTLLRTLRQARTSDTPYHIWHYIGHGAFDEANSASVLLFCDEMGNSHPVDGFQLGTMFADYKETRLALLNACEGARASNNDPFAGVATALVERGIPAVIGMQFEISDQAAIRFSEEFYAAVVDGLPVDSALNEGRRAVFFMPNWVEWATPVLFMGVRDGQLFNVHADPNVAGRAGTDHEVDLTEVKIPNPRLVFTTGALAGQRIEITGDKTIIGRTPENGVAIPEQKVSRAHAQLEKKGIFLWLADLGSTNGTFVNGQRIDEPHKLAQGDVVGIGDSLFSVAYSADSPVEKELSTNAATPGGQPSAPAPSPAPMPQSAPAAAAGMLSVPGRLYEVPNANIKELSERLRQYFFTNQYESQIIAQGPAVVVQGRKENLLRDLVGMSYAATIILEPIEGGFKASVGGGKWVDKAAVAAVGMFVAFGFTVFTAGYGAAQQKMLENALWLQIDQFASVSGGRRIA